MPAYWGVGLATEISRAMLEIAFSRLQLDDVVALIAPSNTASRRVTEKVGGRYERNVVHAGALHGLYRVTRDAYLA
jgi:RimJ/RimL family protein N-acetyltransferase